MTNIIKSDVQRINIYPLYAEHCHPFVIPDFIQIYKQYQYETLLEESDKCIQTIQGNMELINKDYYELHELDPDIQAYSETEFLAHLTNAGYSFFLGEKLINNPITEVW